MNKLITLAMISEELDKNNLILESNKVMHTMMKLSQKETDSCPAATQNIKLNLKNRQKAIDEYGYGPADPSQPNNKFWKEKMDMWKVDELSEVKNMLCGNCAAFDITSKALDCISEGIGSEEDPESTIKAGKLGYCKFLKFKCASKRTCDSWVTGGPIEDK